MDSMSDHLKPEFLRDNTLEAILLVRDAFMQAHTKVVNHLHDHPEVATWAKTGLHPFFQNHVVSSLVSLNNERRIFSVTSTTKKLFHYNVSGVSVLYTPRVLDHNGLPTLTASDCSKRFTTGNIVIPGIQSSQTPVIVGCILNDNFASQFELRVLVMKSVRSIYFSRPIEWFGGSGSLDIFGQEPSSPAPDILSPDIMPARSNPGRKTGTSIA